MPTPNCYLPLIIPVITFLLGIISTWLYKKWDNRLIFLRRRVLINQLGFSAEDQNWGNLKLYYEGEEIQNIHFITIEIANDSNRDLENLCLELGLPETCAIYRHNTQYWWNGLTKEQLLEKEFAAFFQESNRKIKAYLSVNPNTKLPAPLQSEMTHVSRHRKFDIPVFNRNSKIVLQLLVETFERISERDVYTEFFKKGLKIVPQLEEDKREKIKKAWTEYSAIAIFSLLGYPIFKYATTIGMAVTLMIINLFVASFLALLLYNFMQWIKKVIKY